MDLKSQMRCTNKECFQTSGREEVPRAGFGEKYQRGIGFRNGVKASGEAKLTLEGLWLLGAKRGECWARAEVLRQDEKVCTHHTGERSQQVHEGQIPGLLSTCQGHVVLE